ncbi:phage portal protein family protein [Tateyamaria sp.]|uniref:phage portal protein family protein n=1 Tax=Tateyamaria sp. TaxID=1929288 RepID=UPI003B21D1E0
MMMDNETRPARPEAGEITPPALTLQIEGGGVWDQTRPWMEELGSDPRVLGGGRGSTRLLEITLGDPKVRACLGQRLDAGTAAPLEVKPGGPMRRDRQAAEDLGEQLACLEIDRITRELLHGIWFGYAVAECIWEIEGSRVRLADLRVRAPSVLRWDPITHEPLLLTRQTPSGQPLPPAKFVLLTAPRVHGGQPHGPGIGNWAFWPVWLKRFACSSWATALERFGIPLATATVRNRTGEEARHEMREALSALAALASGTSLVLPEGVELNVIESSRRAGGDYEIFVRDMDRMIADAVIGQHGTAEIGPHVGTGEVHMKILERLVTADARRCADALRRSVATWLTHWNYPGAAVPLLRRETAPPEDLKARSERDFNIARASGLRPAREYIEDIYGGVWEEAPPQAMPPVPGAHASETQSVNMSAPRHALAAPTPPAAPIDALVSHLIEDDIATTAAAPMTAAFEAALAEATSLEDLRSRLEAIEQTTPPAALASLVGRADFAAGVAGVTDAPLVSRADGGDVGDG